MYNGGPNQSTGGYGNASGWVPMPQAVQSGTYAKENPEGERVLILDGLTNQLAMTNSRILDLIANVRSHADKLVGCVPEKASNGGIGGIVPPQPSRIAGLSEAVSSADALVTELWQQINRLTAL